MTSEWKTLVDDERGVLKVEFNSGMVFLHVKFRQVMAGMRSAKAMFPTVKEMLRGMGYKRIHVIIPEGDDALYRFERYFGFRDVRRIGGHILMEQEC